MCVDGLNVCVIINVKQNEAAEAAKEIVVAEIKPCCALDCVCVVQKQNIKSADS